MAENGVKWKMGIPELIIIVSLIIALATTLNMKAPAKDVSAIGGRVLVLEGQFTTIVSNQVRVEAVLREISMKQQEILERLARIEESRETSR